MKAIIDPVLHYVDPGRVHPVTLGDILSGIRRNGHQSFGFLSIAREKATVITARPEGKVLWIMLEIEVVDDRIRRDIAAEREKSVRGKEAIDALLLERLRKHPLEPDVIEERMPRGRIYNMSPNIGRELLFELQFPIEEPMEFVFRGGIGQAVGHFGSELADPVQFPWEKKPCIDPDPQVARLNGEGRKVRPPGVLIFTPLSASTGV